MNALQQDVMDTIEKLNEVNDDLLLFAGDEAQLWGNGYLSDDDDDEIAKRRKELAKRIISIGENLLY